MKLYFGKWKPSSQIPNLKPNSSKISNHFWVVCRNEGPQNQIQPRAPASHNLALLIIHRLFEKVGACPSPSKTNNHHNIENFIYMVRRRKYFSISHPSVPVEFQRDGASIDRQCMRTLLINCIVASGGVKCTE